MTETGESVLGARSLSLSLPVSLLLREVLITQTTLAWQRGARLSPNAGLLGRAFVLAARQVPTCHRAVLPAPATSPPPLPGQGRFNAHALSSPHHGNYSSNPVDKQGPRTMAPGQSIKTTTGADAKDSYSKSALPKVPRSNAVHHQFKPRKCQAAS